MYFSSLLVSAYGTYKMMSTFLPISKILRHMNKLLR